MYIRWALFCELSVLLSLSCNLYNLYTYLVILSILPIKIPLRPCSFHSGRIDRREGKEQGWRRIPIRRIDRIFTVGVRSPSLRPAPLSTAFARPAFGPFLFSLSSVCRLCCLFDVRWFSISPLPSPAFTRLAFGRLHPRRSLVEALARSSPLRQLLAARRIILLICRVATCSRA